MRIAGRRLRASWATLAGCGALSCVAAPPPIAASPCAPPAAEPAAIRAFVAGGCFESWAGQPRHLSGAVVDGVPYTAHGEIQVFYSPGVERWIEGGSAGIPEGEAIVAVAREERAPARVREVLVKVRSQGLSHDGWFWSAVRPGVADGTSGRQGDSSCLACHGSASALGTFLTPGGPVSTAGWRPDAGLVFPDPPPVGRRLPRPLAEPDRGFLETYGLDGAPRTAEPFPPSATDRVPANGPARFAASDACRGCHNAGQLLSNSRPNLWYPDPEGGDPVYRNYSPFGEWSGSLHALAARDPIWHAEMEAEVERYPQLEEFIHDTCFTCHGPMAGRQLRADTGNPGAHFTLPMFFADRPGEPGLEYGALARDGVSCAVCHRIEPTLLGVDLPPAAPGDQVLFDGFDPHRGYGLSVRPARPGSYSGGFSVDTTGQLFGPYDDPILSPMRNAIGFTPVGGAPAAQISEAALCGSCHLIVVPAIPKAYDGADPAGDPSLDLVFEQTTYWEWRNSFWENESKGSGLACQDCHMAAHRDAEGQLLARRIANIESDRFPPAQGRLADASIHLDERFPYPRHTFLGINLFAMEMFQQFPELLGSRRPDPAVPERTLDSLLTAGDWMTRHAREDTALINVYRAEPLSVDGAPVVEFDVQVTNNAGHKFPTGTGIRRAFIELTVLGDEGRVLWASGGTNDYGVIVDRRSREPLASEFTTDPAASQPHYQVIDAEDQVQIYESRTLGEEGELVSTVLGIFGEHKDNRVLPTGWTTEAPAGGGTFQTDRRFPNKGSINMFAIHPRLPGDNPVPSGTPLDDVPDYCRDPGNGLGFDRDYCLPEYTEYGSDVVTYRVPRERIEGWRCVQARILYQSIPPYYLKELFGEDPDHRSLGPAARRLLYIASRLDFDESAIDDWTLQVGELTSRLAHGTTESRPVRGRCGAGGFGEPMPPAGEAPGEAP